MSLRLDEQEKPIRALGLTSGGLDSLLALLVIRNQGIQVQGLTFVSPFLKPDSAIRGCKALNIPLRVEDFTKQHLQVVKDPKFGHGKNMNPCLDCHALMFRLAHRIREEGFHFIFSGEVMGQRPMSQNKQSLGVVARESGAPEYIVRPLSAKNLPPSLPEEKGWVDRERLFDFQGRSRKPQMALAENLGLKEYPTPAGGCPLTEPGFSRRLKNLLAIQPLAGPEEIELLRLGRHFDLGGGHKLILGRNQSENNRIAQLIPPGGLSLKAAGVPGPTGLLSHPGLEAPDLDLLSLAGRIVLSYADAQGSEAGLMIISGETQETLVLPVEKKIGFAQLMVN